MSEEEREIWQLDCQKNEGAGKSRRANTSGTPAREAQGADDASEREAQYAAASMIRSPTATAAIEKASISQAQHAKKHGIWPAHSLGLAVLPTTLILVCDLGWETGRRTGAPGTPNARGLRRRERAGGEGAERDIDWAMNNSHHLSLHFCGLSRAQSATGAQDARGKGKGCERRPTVRSSCTGARWEYIIALEIMLLGGSLMKPPPSSLRVRRAVDVILLATRSSMLYPAGGGMVGGQALAFASANSYGCGSHRISRHRRANAAAAAGWTSAVLSLADLGSPAAVRSLSTCSGGKPQMGNDLINMARAPFALLLLSTSFRASFLAQLLPAFLAWL
ncbi:hypothetical protein C8J57DRAFT_1245126 [Mycena rebaudengoi]|nr:hypothetical protein C8J57DRAFT_1245126 [Mycena rebaudengoi]